MNKNIILVGGGGHCKSCIDIIETESKYKIKGIIDIPEKLGQDILSYKIIGIDEDIPNLTKSGVCFLITVGHIKNSKLRIKLFNLIKENRGDLPVIMSSLAYVSKYSIIGEGTIIMHQAVVNVLSNIGKNCIINNQALIEHDVKVGNNNHISTNANINGDCIIGNNCFIGSGATIKNGISITDNCIIGAGTVVIKNIEESGVYVGCPAIKIR